jgi:signal transduction histidine kinase
MKHGRFAENFVQSQAIGLTIAACCWSVAPWVERAEGDPRIAFPLFGIAIAVGVGLGMLLASAATRWLFPESLAPEHGLMSMRTAVFSLSIAIAGTVVFYGRERLRHARTRAESEGWRAIAAERSAAQAQLQALRAQVEPHFLFNTLAGVRSAITSDPARAAALIDSLADYLRAAIPRLRSDGGAEATLAGQVDIARAYLALMVARMPRLSFSIELPADLGALGCPPLMLVSLVENAIKHGAEPKVGPVHVALQAQLDALGRLQVSVSDDGAGFGASVGGTGIGLANIRERLHQMHGERAALVLRARPEGGVCATLTWPID